MARLLTHGGTDYLEAGDSPLPHSGRSSPMASRWGGAPCAPQSCCSSYPAPSHQGLSRPGAPRGHRPVNLRPSHRGEFCPARLILARFLLTSL